MKNKLTQCMLIACVSLTIVSARAQQGTPVVPAIGQPLPDLTFRVEYEQPGVKKLSALRDKPVLLYFFSRGCVGSFDGLSRYQELYRKFGKRIHFIASGSDRKDGARAGYEIYRRAYDYQLPVEFDTVNFRLLGIRAYPAVILLDKQGIVRAVTTSSLTAEALDGFLAGKPFTFKDTSRAAKEEVEKNVQRYRSMFTGVDSTTQRSMITEWKPGMPHETLQPVFEHRDPLRDLKSIQIMGRSLADLYRVAYFGRGITWNIEDTAMYGKYHFGLALELADDSKFRDDWTTGKNLFCYSQVMLPHNRTRDRMMAMMQDDLKNCFGYDASVELRKMPYLKLVVTGSAPEKLNRGSQGKSKLAGDNVAGGKFENISIDLLIRIISHPARLVSRDLPLLDETGITGTISVNLNAAMTSLDDIRRALRENGLDIVQGEKLMNVLVLRDPRLPEP